MGKKIRSTAKDIVRIELVTVELIMLQRQLRVSLLKNSSVFNFVLEEM